MTYVSEWCETPSSRVPGIVYKDTAVLYDVGDQHVMHSHMNKNLNVYLCIPHTLLDPVLGDAVAELQRFYRQTFWANIKFFRCCQALAYLCVCADVCDSVRQNIRALQLLVGAQLAGLPQCIVLSCCINFLTAPMSLL